MALPAQHVLRLRRTDDRSAKHMLINIAKKGRNELDLKLTGTDQEILFIASFTEAESKKFQDRNFKGNLEEWKALLMFALLHHQPEDTLPEFSQGVETVTSISESKESKGRRTATITIRRNVDGITQRLCTIPLEQTDMLVDTLPWIDTAAAEADELRSQLGGLQASIDSQKDYIAKLTTELDMLVRAKTEHEAELLSKFVTLLNAKKLKIRDQQRLLKGAKIDIDAAQDASHARLGKTSRKVDTCRGGKRKANGRSLSRSEEEDGEDDDNNDSGDGASRHDQVTPELEEPDMADGREDEEVGAFKSISRASHKSSQGRSEPEAEPMDVDKEAPTRKIATRNMPSKAKEPTPLPRTNTNNDDDETDDEL